MRELDIVKEVAAKRKVPLVYLWYGEDRFLIQEALKVLKGLYFENDPSGSGIEVVSARTLSPKQIVEKANTISFFQQRLLIVEDVTYFQEGQSEELQEFYNYFVNPNPSTCLLFVAENIHKGRKFYKELESHGSVLEFNAPKRQQEWQSWLEAELKARGKSMRLDVKNLFLDWAGHYPGVLSQELDKLCVFVGEREQIRSEDIKQVIAQNADTTVFELLDAVAARTPAQALEKLQQVLRLEHPLKVLTLLVRQVRLLLGIKSFQQEGGTLADAPRALSIKQFEAQKLWEKAPRFSQEQLAQALKECLQTELALKTGKGEASFMLELMIAKFCLK